VGGYKYVDMMCECEGPLRSEWARVGEIEVLTRLSPARFFILSRKKPAE
jgi:hypothetical protein